MVTDGWKLPVAAVSNDDQSTQYVPAFAVSGMGKVTVFSQILRVNVVGVGVGTTVLKIRYIVASTLAVIRFVVASPAKTIDAILFGGPFQTRIV